MSTHSGPPVRLPASFWPATAVMTVITIAALLWEWFNPLGKFLPQAARPADQIDDLFMFLTLVATVIFIYVVGYLLYFAWIYRVKPGTPLEELGLQLHDSTRLEIWWTVIPTILVIVLGVVSTLIWARMQQEPGTAFTMEAIGHQWKYEFRYPGMKHSVWNEMHVPINKPITMHVTSSDVIHSFWVPEGRLKMDMVPGLVNTVRFTPTRLGKYRIICTEFCGFDHGKMLAFYYVDSEQDFQKWFDAQNKMPAAGGGAAVAATTIASGDAAAGKALFEQKCTACHSVGAFSQRKVGPGLGDLLHDSAHPKLVTGEDATPENIAHVLQKGAQGDMGVMPNAEQNALNGKDIANLVAYLSSLSK